MRLELDEARKELRTLAAQESATPVADLLELRYFQTDLLEDVAETASQVISRMQRGQDAAEATRSWRRAVDRYERSLR